MRRVTLLLFIPVTFLSFGREDEEVENQLTPTDLTIVATDAKGAIIDCVAVDDDDQSRSVVFRIPDGYAEIRVFALGPRVHDSISRDYYLKGRPDNDKWMGLGYVEAQIEKGILVAFDANGAGPLTVTEAMQASIIDNLRESKQLTITTVNLIDE